MPAAPLPPFRHGHATHPDWRVATDLAYAQLDGGGALDGLGHAGDRMGVVYVTEPYAGHLAAIADQLRQRTGIAHWTGAAGQGICATGAEYVDEPAIAAMVGPLPPDGFRMFAGQTPGPGADEEGWTPFTALVHGDPGSPDLPALIGSLANRVETGYLFGGLAGGAGGRDGVAPQFAGRMVRGGLSGVMFSGDVRLLSRVTQGCRPLAGAHVISDCVSHYVKSLDGQPALDVLLADLGVAVDARRSRDGDEILRALPRERLRRGLLVGLAPASADHGIGFGDYMVRNLVGIDPQNRLLAIAAQPEPGERMVFCTRDQAAARADLIRICTELREDVEGESLSIRGALYHSCVARGRHLFGSQGAELDIIRHNLGDIPLIGLYANGEIARNRLYGHTGVLTLFV
jgi:small ligand-binding sensory domain FIST